MKKNLGNILFFSLCGILVLIFLSQIGILPIRFIYLYSGSMRPTYQPGDMAVVFVGNDLSVKPGDVVLFQSPVGATIHRVAAIENGLISTKGDANNIIDDNKLNKVDGKVLLAIPKLGYVFDLFQIALRNFVNAFRGIKAG